MDGPPPRFPTASGLATFTPCGDRRWRVAIDDEFVGELFEEFHEEPGDAVGWGADTADGRTCPRRDSWMSALDDLPRPGTSP